MPVPRVLVIDDDEIARELMCELLRGSGFDVMETGSPIGVSRLIALHRIDALVLDIVMPNIMGDKLAKLLRSNPRLDSLSIVLVSGGDAQALASIGAAVSADSVVVKSDLRDQLPLAVYGACRRRALSRVLQRET